MDSDKNFAPLLIQINPWQENIQLTRPVRPAAWLQTPSCRSEHFLKGQSYFFSCTTATLTLLIHQLGSVVHVCGCGAAVICRHLVVEGKKNSVRETFISFSHLRYFSMINPGIKSSRTGTSNSGVFDIKIVLVTWCNEELHIFKDLIGMEVQEQPRSPNTEYSYRRWTN